MQYRVGQKVRLLHESGEGVIVNPEPSDALFTVFSKSAGNKYVGLASGSLGAGERSQFLTLELGDLNKLKSFYFQMLLFLPGKGYPHAPLQKELDWNKGRLQNPPKILKAFQNKEGWVFNLREDKQNLDIKKIKENELVKVREIDDPSHRKIVEEDLHIEELVKRPDRLTSAEMLQIQLQHFKKKYDESVMNHDECLIVIHGIGLGILKKEVHKFIKGKPEIKEIAQADPKKYGNGATKIIFNFTTYHLYLDGLGLYGSSLLCFWSK